jgi:hypothetical protein
VQERIVDCCLGVRVCQLSDCQQATTVSNKHQIQAIESFSNRPQQHNPTLPPKKERVGCKSYNHEFELAQHLDNDAMV